MFSQSTAALLLATTLAATPALAQTAIPSQNTAPMAVPNAGQSTSSATGTNGAFLTNDQTSGMMWRGSKLVGISIYGPDDEKVGDVNDMLIDQQGSIRAIVIGVGGFLGLGEKDVAMPFNQVQWVDQPRTTAAAGRGTTNSAGNGNAANQRSTEMTGTTAPRGTMNRNYPDHGRIALTRDQLRAAPSYRLDR